uniref:AAA+ ATPase domain-containing protein n=1 Tax=Spumella elongata TaxID=89044 RepID=A0A7S3LY20_9STRA|mmetsp:Transcript_10499/g.18312  ORF Transcript_10499/g.18312 Transcript_10499/m.18312 type:complete len:718 (+) Transcript_10499:54-2207(+)
MRWIAFVLLILLEFAKADETDPSGKFLLYSDIQVANRTESLLRLRNVPIVRYKFKYDSLVDRYQLGIIGPDAQKYFAESIEVVPSKTFTSKDRSKAPTVVTNFPVVDKNVLFMHGLVALQELIFRYEALSAAIDSAETDASKRKDELLAIEKRITSGVSAQSKTKLEIAQKEAELALKQAQLDAQKAEEEMLLVQRELEHEKEMVEYEANLVRERMARQEELEKLNNEQVLKMEKELAEKRELLARETNEALQKLRQTQSSELEQQKLEHEKEKIRVEIDAKAAQKRIQQEMELLKMRTQSKLDTERMITGIKTISAQVSRIVSEIFAKPKQVAIVTGIILGLIALYYVFKELFKLLRQYVQSRIGKPSLVRETSFTYSIVPHFIANYFSRPEELSSSRKKLEEAFSNIILSSEDKQRVVHLALATRNTKQSDAPFRHVLLHGSPGTGKTLIARRLAASSGMDYAIMSGGDVAPLGEDAVSQLHGLFQWAARSRKGLLVFIDEAEAFLAARTSVAGAGSGDGASSEVHIRNALNALLYQTGTPSHNFMLILATNRPQDLDVAVLDRIDVSIPITPPALPQRLELVKLYLNEHVVKVANQSQQSRSVLSKLFGSTRGVRYVTDDCLSEPVLHRIAAETEGFSGREIAKLFIAAQYAMFLAEKSTLTAEILLETVALKVEEHHIKRGNFAQLRTAEHAVDGKAPADVSAPISRKVKAKK